MKRRGNVYSPNGKRVLREITCRVTGSWWNGTKVWTECDKDGNLVNEDQQYVYFKSGKEFAKI